jgi:tRNA (mo5U34)-methyltransferase
MARRVNSHETGPISADLLRKEVFAREWHHVMDLGHGVVTPGRDATQAKLLKLGLPSSLEGKTVLDIGAWDGFFSFEAERRGAARVLAMDYDCWLQADGHPSKAGFEIARRALRSAVGDVTLDVMELTPERVGVFDVVLFLGVLYHLRHPLFALERVFSVTADLLILETEVMRLGTRRPMMVFFPRDELAGDASNWWGPNEAAIIAMLRDVGFREVRVVASRRPAVSAARAARRLVRAVRSGDAAPVTTASADRIVVHARR